ncbi:uncharacterized protein LOC132904437 [Amyelois transitella]|uniref:uncharacterized protein LOC132904437 n=1 Tax=Amyelois transitella TaxID=680683 RepID=UPI0029903115|nr:uncharacterized protein LOC132904437 [Amyelois transitella]
MRRKEPSPSPGTGRGKSLIAMRTSQHQQRKSAKSLLPRSYSSPAPYESDVCQTNPLKTYVLRSFSSPEHKQDFRRNSDSFYRPKTHGSRTELDSDLENFEHFEECFIDIDADQDDNILRSFKPEETRKVTATILPGSRLQKVTYCPMPSTTSTLQGARDAMKKMKDDKGTRPNFRPLVLKMSARHQFFDTSDNDQGMEELQDSPPLELEAAELDRELSNAEQHLEREVAIATEESDADTAL